MQVKIDGTDVSDHIIRQSTTQPFNFIIKPDNSDNWDAPIVGGNNTSMAENYYLFFKTTSTEVPYNRFRSNKTTASSHRARRT